MRNHRGQSTAEYAVVIGVVVAAIIAMQVYVRRGMQAKVKDVTDHFTSQFGSTKQFEPDFASSDFTVAQDRSASEQVTKGYEVDRTGISETTSRTGSATTGAPR